MKTFYILVRVLRVNGTEADYGELGRIVVKLPLPPGTMSTLYRAPERFCQIYFTHYHVLFLNNLLYLIFLYVNNFRVIMIQWMLDIKMNMDMFM